MIKWRRGEIWALASCVLVLTLFGISALWNSKECYLVAYLVTLFCYLVDTFLKLRRH